MTLKNHDPKFFIIGAQKAGTSWLWDMLDQHPGTSLPVEKEIHYYGSVELFRNGEGWYKNYFKELDASKLIGDASTTYFYDRMPFWHNKSRESEFDESLPPIPEIINSRHPDAKYIVILRDPVRRAISSYLHFMKRGYDSPLKGLSRTVRDWPKLRIVEYGNYRQHLEAWQSQIPPERLKIIIFEDQIKQNSTQTLRDVYEFLDLDPEFSPTLPTKAVHPSWGWTRIVFSYYAGKIYKPIGFSYIARFFDKHNFLSNRAIKNQDVEFLRSEYLPEKERLEAILGRDLDCWDYGSKLL